MVKNYHQIFCDDKSGESFPFILVECLEKISCVVIRSVLGSHVRAMNFVNGNGGNMNIKVCEVWMLREKGGA